MDWQKQVRRGVTASLFMTTAAWVQSAAAEGRLPDDELRAAYDAAWQAAPVPVQPAVPKASATLAEWTEPDTATPAAPVPHREPAVAAVRIEPVLVPQAPTVTVERFRIPYEPQNVAAQNSPSTALESIPLPPAASVYANAPLPVTRQVASTAPLRNFTTQPVVIERTQEFQHAALLPPPQSAFADPNAQSYAQMAPAAGATTSAANQPAAAATGADPLLTLPGLPPPAPVPASKSNGPPALMPETAAATTPTPPQVVVASAPTDSKDIFREAKQKVQEVRDNGGALPTGMTPAIQATPAVVTPVMPAVADASSPVPYPAAPISASAATPATAVADGAMPSNMANGGATAPVPSPTAPVPVAKADATSAAAVASTQPSAPVTPIPVPGSATPAASVVKAKAAPKVSPNERFKPRSATTEAVMDSQKKRLVAQARDAEAGAPISLDRSKEGDARLQSDEGIKKHNGVGVSISVRKPALNANYELNEAYQASANGDSGNAIAIYQRVVDADPKNTDALFGLATMYHRIGRLDKAKPIYLSLLAVDPGHKDGLNNFLMLLGEENPQEALTRLKTLEQANPGYAPIPAQMAMILQRTGDLQGAVDAMSRASARDRDNMQYRYNLAVLLDQAGNWTDAASMYKDVLLAVDRGERVPATRDGIQQRLTYLMSRHT